MTQEAIRIRVAALLQAIAVAAIAVAVSGSWWMVLLPFFAFGIAGCAGTVVDQGVMTGIYVALCLFARHVLMPIEEVPPSVRALLLGAALALAAGWAVSAFAEWVFGIKIRRI